MFEPQRQYRPRKAEAPKRRCHHCHGKGTTACRSCGGTGRTPTSRNVFGEPNYARCTACFGNRNRRCTACAGTGFTD